MPTRGTENSPVPDFGTSRPRVHASHDPLAPRTTQKPTPFKHFHQNLRPFEQSDFCYGLLRFVTLFKFNATHHWLVPDFPLFPHCFPLLPHFPDFPLLKTQKPQQLRRFPTFPTFFYQSRLRSAKTAPPVAPKPCAKADSSRRSPVRRRTRRAEALCEGGCSTCSSYFSFFLCALCGPLCPLCYIFILSSNQPRPIPKPPKILLPTPKISLTFNP